MEKKSNLSRLLGYAGGHRYLLYASWLLSAVSALVALVPFLYIWRIMQEVLETAPDFGNAQGMTHNGWMAVLFSVLAVLIYIAGLMCSHMGAFRVATNLRLETMRHIVRLPLGYAERFGTGKLRKIVNESSAATETYLAHQLPDRAGAIATPCGLLVLLFVFDWRLGLLSLVPVLLGFLIMMAMTGAKMQQKMKEYQNALEDMSNEAVEYVRGIPVVKTFGQTIFSFKKFRDSIERYKIWVIAYTKQLRAPMMFYTAAINGVFVFLIAGGLLFTRDGVTTAFLLNLIFNADRLMLKMLISGSAVTMPQNMVRRVSVISDSDEIGPELVETYIQENRGLSAAGGSLRSRYTLEEALALSGGNKLRAAELLGISRATLYRMLERKGM